MDTVSPLFSLDEVPKFFRIQGKQQDPMEWIQTRLIEHPEQCLAAIKVDHTSIDENYEAVPFIFYVLSNCPYGQEHQFSKPLIQQALQLSHPLSTLRFQGSGLLHWVVRAFDSQKGDHCLENIRLMFSQTLPLYERDNGAEGQTAASYVIDRNYPQVFEFLVQHYDENHFEGERPQWEQQIGAKEHWDVEEVARFRAILVAREAQLLGQTLGSSAPKARLVSRL